MGKYGTKNVFTERQKLRIYGIFSEFHFFCANIIFGVHTSRLVQVWAHNSSNFEQGIHFILATPICGGWASTVQKNVFTERQKLQIPLFLC